MKTLTFSVTLSEPTLATALDGDPNSGVSTDWLPGSVIRGVVIEKYLQGKGNSVIDATDETERRLFLDGSTRFLNGYPTDTFGKRSLPVPLSWFSLKENREVVFDLARPATSPPEGKLQAVGKPFFQPHDTAPDDEDFVPSVLFISPERTISVHTARTRRPGRAIEAAKQREDDTPGAVFRYDALAPGQTFAAAAICNDKDAATLRNLLDGGVTLGGSRTGGYGKAEIGGVEEHDDWRENEFPRSNEPLLYVALMSDLLLRDDTGWHNVDSKVFQSALEKKLGLPADAIKVRAAFLRETVVGGFNRKWGLPLPQVQAFRMGSVFVLEAPAGLDDKLDQLEASGFGERLADGFGRLMFNRQPFEEMQVVRAQPSPTEDPEKITEPDALAIARRMTGRLLRAELDEHVLQAANSVVFAVEERANSQLARIREHVREQLMKPSPDPDAVKSFLDGLRPTAKKRLQTVRIGERPVVDWILQQIDKAALESTWGRSTVPAVGNIPAESSDELRREYALRLVDAVLARAMKSDTE